MADREPAEDPPSPEEQPERDGPRSAELKAEANSLFSSGKYDEALNTYHEATALCPETLDFELAVLWSNIAACHLKLEEWKDAAKDATSALDHLDKAARDVDGPRDQEGGGQEADQQSPEDEVEEEIVSAGASRSGPAVRPEDAAEERRKRRREDIQRIRAKALMRRARARCELGGWANLEGALEDYKALEALSAGQLSAADRKMVRAQLRALPARVAEAKERETAEMWGKLKELGNGLLKPFGLSTDNFQMVKDEKTGGYSMNFTNGAAK